MKDNDTDSRKSSLQRPNTHTISAASGRVTHTQQRAGQVGKVRPMTGQTLVCVLLGFLCGRYSSCRLSSALRSDLRSRIGQMSGNSAQGQKRPASGE